MSLGDKITLVEMAVLAKKSERYNDMVSFMKSITKAGFELNSKERKLLSFAYKNVICPKRSSCITIFCDEQNCEKSEQIQKIAREYREVIEKEIREVCYEMLNLVNQYLIPKARDAESKVFYLKLQADYNRYLAEVTLGETRNDVINKARAAYEEGFEISKSNLTPTNAVRMALALNFAVFYHDILDCTDEAYQLAKQTLDNARPSDYDNLDTDSIVIIQSIKVNLMLWGIELQDGNGEGQEEVEEMVVQEEEVQGEGEGASTSCSVVSV